MVSAPFSGIEVHFRLLARELAAHPDVDLVGSVWLRHPTEDPVGRIPVLGKNWYVTGGWSTWRALRDADGSGDGFDVAFLNQMNPVLMAGPLPGLPPIVLHLDATPLITSSMSEHYLGRSPRPAIVERAKRGIYGRSFGMARRIAVASRMVERSLVDEYGVDRDILSLIPYSIDTDFFVRRPDERHTGPTRVLFVGGDFERKGGDLVVAAARLPEFADVEFHLVTGGDVKDAPSNVVLHHGVPPNSETLRRLLADSDLFVLPTWADVSSIASLEAMAMELPVITTPVGGIPEIVEDGVSGYLIPPGDFDALVDRLRALVSSGDRRVTMGRAGRAHVDAQHSLRVNVPRYVDLLRQVATA